MLVWRLSSGELYMPCLFRRRARSFNKNRVKWFLELDLHFRAPPPFERANFLPWFRSAAHRWIVELGNAEERSSQPFVALIETASMSIHGFDQKNTELSLPNSIFWNCVKKSVEQIPAKCRYRDTKVEELWEIKEIWSLNIRWTF